MSLTDSDNKPTGPLARAGKNDSFAGLTRIWIVALPVFVTALFYWGEQDVSSVLRDVRSNQEAIIAIRDRTTHLEDSTANTATSVREFRLWAESQVGVLISNSNGDAKSINALDRRVLCLEKHTLCPQ
jgi:hypothetical protein